MILLSYCQTVGHGNISIDKIYKNKTRIYKIILMHNWLTTLMLSFLFYCSSTGDLVSVNMIESLAKRKRMDKEARLATVQVK